MKLLHLSDLHLGKIVHGFSMLDDQRFILEQILRIVDRESPDAVLICGDVYDKPIPPGEAVRLFDLFLRELTARAIQVFIISGNHDSADRLSFGASLMAPSGIHFSPIYDGEIKPFTFTDESGTVCIYMLPFLKPVQIRHLDADAAVETYTDAVRYAIERMNIDPSCRNILLTHQFVTGAQRCESEEISVGGMDNVDAKVFAPFDYVALGHLHGPQKVLRDTIRYCGTPLAYSFSEKDQTKSVTVVEMPRKGETVLRTAALTPRHALREIRGTYEELTLRDNYLGTKTDDYLHIILTNEQDVPDAVGRLRVIYPNLMKLDYDNTRTHAAAFSQEAPAQPQKSPVELFSELYEKQNGLPMTPQQQALCASLFQKITEGHAL